nr:branched chain amino acid ABC transporter ATPase [Raoultella sp. NCTC 9187]
MSQPMLEFRQVDVFYGQIQALNQVSLTVNEGETVALIGANGAGKSTLLMSIFGQPRIAEGQILYRGEDISRKSTHFIAGNGIAQAPEGRRIFADMTVEENLLMGTIPIGSRYQEEDKRRMYQLFPRLEERRTQRAMTLSGGEQQMLAIARGADEPAEAAAARRAEPRPRAAGGEANLSDPARADGAGDDALSGGAKRPPRAEAL